MNFAVAIISGGFLPACQPEPQPTPPVTAASAQASRTAAERCVGTRNDKCVVYLSGPIEDGAATRRLFYQLQGTGLPGSGDREYCKGGYCAVAILRQRDSGQSHLIAHVESNDAGWFETPEVIVSPSGPIIVARSNSLGTGLSNDDIVLREDEAGRIHRLDVQTWKAEAQRLAPDANTYFAWRTDYRAFVGENGLASREPHHGSRGSVGTARVFLMLEGDALKVGSAVARFPEAEAR